MTGMSADPPTAEASYDTIARPRSVLWRRAGDRVIVLPPGAGNPTVLAGTASTLWDLLEEPGSLEDTVLALAELYRVHPATVLADVRPALEELCRRGVLERREPSGGPGSR